MTKELTIWEDEAKLKEIRDIFCKGATDTEFQTFVGIGKGTQLNPFLREIWLVKYGAGSAQIFIGRDGYRRNAQRNPDYDYHIVDAVYENDSFLVDDGIVKHKYNLSNRGTLIGAYCTIKRKSASKPMFCFVERNEYDHKKSVWREKPATMIKKVVESQTLRMAFQEIFAGTYDESERWDLEEVEKQGVRKNVNAKTQGTLSRLKGSTVQSNVKENQAKTGTYENDAPVDKGGTQSDQVSRQDGQAHVTSPTFATDEQVAQLRKLWEQLGDAPERVQQKIEAISKRLSEIQVIDFSELSEEHAQKLIERLIDLTWECE